VTLVLEPVRVASGAVDEEGCLVVADGRLVAVLVRLSAEHYDEFAGRWYLEAGFGRLNGPEHPTFANLDAAQDWINGRLAHGARRRSGPLLH
jgi:hypothetical protein